MKWIQVDRNWESVKYAFQKNWSKLSDKDLDDIDGSRERLHKCLRAHYDLRPSEAKHHVDRFAARLEK